MTISVASFAVLALASASQDVVTRHVDQARTGWVRSETVLTPATVGSKAFRRLATMAVDGQVYAQPLVLVGLKCDEANGPVVRDLCIIATAHNSVYCFDTRPKTPVQLWRRNLGMSVPWQDVETQDIEPEIGIISTPVIDRDSGTVWVTAKSKEVDGSGNPTYHLRLHALDVRTGEPHANSPAEIEGAVRGAAPDAVNGVLWFSPLRHMTRPGLLLRDGVLHIAAGGHGGNDPYHGWLFAYDAQSLERLDMICTTPDGNPGSSIPSGGGGIWMTGQAPACDEAGAIYFSTANGGYSKDAEPRQIGESFVKAVFDGQSYSIASRFSPKENDAWNAANYDLGTSGVMLVPGTDLAIGGGKTRDFFALDRANLGGYSPTQNNVRQQFDATANGMTTAAAYFDSPRFGPLVYLGGKGDVVQAYRVSNAGLETTPVSVGASTGTWPGTSFAVSSNGTKNGILWALQKKSNWLAVLRAYDANDLTKEIWNSDRLPSDQIGNYVKFNVPTVAAGKVYVASLSSRVHIYGLGLPTTSPIRR